MATLANIQSKLQTKVFDKLGSTLTVRSITSSSDKWGDETTTSTSDTSVVGVPFYFFSQNKNYEQYGQLQEGEFDMIVPFGTTIDLGYQVIFDSRTYDVFQVEKYPYADGNIALLLRMKEALRS
jgi:hypothetical protein